MKVSEFKLRLIKFGNKLIDVYFPGDDISERMISASAKYILKNKVNELDNILEMFSQNGDLNVDEFLEFMKDNMIKDGLKINAHDYFDKNSAFLSIIPNRTLIITKDDLNDILA